MKYHRGPDRNRHTFAERAEGVRKSMIWWKGRDSNPRPRHYECRALTS
jgi:hypothetical protein